MGRATREARWAERPAATAWRLFACFPAGAVLPFPFCTRKFPAWAERGDGKQGTGNHRTESRVQTGDCSTPDWLATNFCPTKIIANQNLGLPKSRLPKLEKNIDVYLVDCQNQ